MTDVTCSIDGCEGRMRARGWCSRHYNRWKYAGDFELQDRATECVHCGGALPPKPQNGPRSSYCSQPCRRRADYVRNFERRSAAAAEKLSEARATTVKKCPQCGVSFSPAKSLKQRFCSKKCGNDFTRDLPGTQCSGVGCSRPVRAKGLCNMHYKALLRSEGRLSTKTPWTDERRDAHYRREALKRQTAVSDRPVILADIAERDGWKCGLCGKRVRKDLMHPHPMSKSLDHVIPLSRGGGHVPENCQLAHLRCNVSKGNREANEQLALLG